LAKLLVHFDLLENLGREGKVHFSDRLHDRSKNNCCEKNEEMNIDLWFENAGGVQKEDQSGK
jgi:hypothetical protein